MKETFRVKDEDGAKMFREIKNNFEEAEISFTPQLLFTTIFMDLEHFRNDGYNTNKYLTAFTQNDLRPIILDFKNYLLLETITNSNLLKGGQKVYDYFINFETYEKFLCKSKKECTLLNQMNYEIQHLFKKYITWAYIHDKIKTLEYLLLSGFQKSLVCMHEWLINNNKITTSITPTYQKPTLIKERILAKNQNNLKMKHGSRNIMKIIHDDIIEDPNEFTIPKMEIKNQQVNFKESDKNVLKKVNFQMNSYLEFKDIKGVDEYYTSRVMFGYVKPIDLNVLPKKNETVKDKYNRIFEDSDLKFYFKGSKHLPCRVKECLDGEHIIIEPTKKYGCALFLAKKEDVNYHKAIMKIDRKKVKRYYHTKKNIDYLLTLI